MVVPQHRTTLLGEKDAVCMVDYAHGRRGNEGGECCTSKKQLRYIGMDVEWSHLWHVCLLD